MIDPVLMPLRIAALPQDALGRPILWFAGAGPRKLERAIAGQRCWICGDRLSRNQAFVIDLASTITRFASEPPSHRECAIYALRKWPNPGVSALFIVRDFRVIAGHSLGAGQARFELGEPLDVLWFCDGKPATRRQLSNVLIKLVLQLAEFVAVQGPEAVEELKAQVHRVMRWLPDDDEDDDATGMSGATGVGEEAAAPDAAAVTTVIIQQRSA